MVNMLPSVIAPFLPILWVLVAAGIWWRQLSSPTLFAVTALLALFGIQAVIAFAWDWWPHFAGNYFLEVSKATPEQMQQRLEAQNRRAIIQAVIVLVTAVPFLWWLKSGLAKVS